MLASSLERYCIKERRCHCDPRLRITEGRLPFSCKVFQPAKAPSFAQKREDVAIAVLNPVSYIFLPHTPFAPNVPTSSYDF